MGSFIQNLSSAATGETNKEIKFATFFIPGLFAVTLSPRPNLISRYSSGLIKTSYLQSIKWITWGLLTLNWIYILWYNKNRQDRYRELINKIGEHDIKE